MELRPLDAQRAAVACLFVSLFVAAHCAVWALIAA
jgi:hypothetical protein